MTRLRRPILDTQFDKGHADVNSSDLKGPESRNRLWEDNVREFVEKVAGLESGDHVEVTSSGGRKLYLDKLDKAFALMGKSRPAHLQHLIVGTTEQANSGTTYVRNTTRPDQDRWSVSEEELRGVVAEGGRVRLLLAQDVEDVAGHVRSLLSSLGAEAGAVSIDIETARFGLECERIVSFETSETSQG